MQAFLDVNLTPELRAAGRLVTSVTMARKRGSDWTKSPTPQWDCSQRPTSRQRENPAQISFPLVRGLA